MTGFASVQKHLTAITTAQTDFAKSSIEASKASFENITSVKSPDKFVELTTEYAKSAQATFAAEATKIGELSKTFVQEAFKPFTSASCRKRANKKVTQWLHLGPLYSKSGFLRSCNAAFGRKAKPALTWPDPQSGRMY